MEIFPLLLKHQALSADKKNRLKAWNKLDFSELTGV